MNWQNVSKIIHGIYFKLKRRICLNIKWQWGVPLLANNLRDMATIISARSHLRAKWSEIWVSGGSIQCILLTVVCSKSFWCHFGAFSIIGSLVSWKRLVIERNRRKLQGRGYTVYIQDPFDSEMFNTSWRSFGEFPIFDNHIKSRIWLVVEQKVVK